MNIDEYMVLHGLWDSDRNTSTPESNVCADNTPTKSMNSTLVISYPHHTFEHASIDLKFGWVRNKYLLYYPLNFEHHGPIIF
jgi:hypothetical protein